MANEKRLHLLQKNIIGWVLTNNEPFISEDVAHDLRFTKKILEDIPIGSAICVPLQVERRVSGHVLAMIQKQDQVFESEDLAYLQKLAAISLPFLTNAQQLREYFEASMPENSLSSRYEPLGLLGKSPKFRELLRAIDAAAKCDVRVFLEGQSGTGKELIARAIHRLSERRQHHFVAIDCGAIRALRSPGMMRGPSTINGTCVSYSCGVPCAAR